MSTASPTRSAARRHSRDSAPLRAGLACRRSQATPGRPQHEGHRAGRRTRRAADAADQGLPEVARGPRRRTHAARRTSARDAAVRRHRRNRLRRRLPRGNGRAAHPRVAGTSQAADAVQPVLRRLEQPHVALAGPRRDGRGLRRHQRGQPVHASGLQADAARVRERHLHRAQAEAPFRHRRHESPRSPRPRRPGGQDAALNRVPRGIARPGAGPRPKGAGAVRGDARSARARARDDRHVLARGVQRARTGRPGGAALVFHRRGCLAGDRFPCRRGYGEITSRVETRPPEVPACAAASRLSTRMTVASSRRVAAYATMPFQLRGLRPVAGYFEHWGIAQSPAELEQFAPDVVLANDAGAFPELREYCDRHHAWLVGLRHGAANKYIGPDPEFALTDFICGSDWDREDFARHRLSPLRRFFNTGNPWVDDIFRIPARALNRHAPTILFAPTYNAETSSA